MANYKFQRVVLACWFFFGICMLYIIIPSFVEGEQVIPEKYRGLEHKGTIKTIVSPEDVIDCVDFYKQPAFDDPRIKVEDHLLPDETHDITNDELKELGLYQNWLNYGECPNGTIPIRRTLNREIYKKKRLPSGGRSSANLYSSNSTANYNRPSHEYAIVQYFNFGYGARAKLNVWNPEVDENDYSQTQILVEANHGISETIEAGWIVYPRKFGDSHTRFFIYYVNSDPRPGCFNLECSAFVQVNKKVALGAVLKKISAYKTPGYYLQLSIHKEKYDGDWGLYAFGGKLGYWTNSHFIYLKKYGEVFEWGGEVSNTKPPGQHSITEMGSGFLPHKTGESLHVASYVSNIDFLNNKMTDKKLFWEGVKNYQFKRFASRPECYNVTLVPPSPKLGTHLYYGGAGYSIDCK